MKFQNPFAKELSTKIRLQKWTYLIFYACVITSLATGLLIVFGPDSWKDSLEEIHVLGIYYLIAFLVVHIAGVLRAEFTNQKGIISRIVSGGDNKE